MDCASCEHRVWLEGVSKHICTACEDGQIPDDSLLHYFITKTQHPDCPFRLTKISTQITKEVFAMSTEVNLWNEYWKLDPRPKQRCPKCNRLWPDPSRFCGFCGVRLDKLQPPLDCKGIIHKTNEPVVGKADSH